MSFVERIGDVIAPMSKKGVRKMNETIHVTETLDRVAHAFEGALLSNGSFHQLSEDSGLSAKEMLTQFISRGIEPDGHLYITIGRNRFLNSAFEILISPDLNHCSITTPAEPQLAKPAFRRQKLAVELPNLLEQIQNFNFTGKTEQAAEEKAA